MRFLGLLITIVCQKHSNYCQNGRRIENRQKSVKKLDRVGVGAKWIADKNAEQRFRRNRGPTHSVQAIWLPEFVGFPLFDSRHINGK